jgi:hypothetical protein
MADGSKCWSIDRGYSNGGSGGDSADNSVLLNSQLIVVRNSFSILHRILKIGAFIIVIFSGDDSMIPNRALNNSLQFHRLARDRDQSISTPGWLKSSNR